MSWDKSPALFADLLTQDTVKHTQRISRDMLKAIVQKSPIDTTRFVSNTLVSFDVPDYSYEKDKFVGRAGALREGMTAINAMSKIQTVYIQDNTPYGKYLEAGRSIQAVQGVYRVSFIGIATWYR